MRRVLASNANSTIIFSAILALLLQIPSISVAEDPSIWSCYNSDNYTSGSQFETNLNQTFASLYSNTPLTRFNTTISGNAPNLVYGLFQCRGDSTQDECRSCVNTSATEIVRRCPNRKQGSIRYWGCVLRFSDSDFFGKIDGQSPIMYYYTLDNVTDVTLFNEKVGGLMDYLSNTAAESPSRFATGRNSSVNVFQSIYGMLQCTSDLSSSDCYGCLRNIIADIPSCCNWRSGGNVYTVSCFLRYDSYSFFALLSPPPPSSIQASPPAVDAGGTNTTQGKGISTSTIVIISTVVPAVIVVVSYVCCCKKRKLKSEDDGEQLCFRRKLKSEDDGLGDVSMVQSFQFDFETIRAATADFSDLNKLGQGGFGPVYKMVVDHPYEYTLLLVSPNRNGVQGKLLSGQEIAVKRLSGNSTQGEKEFKNEVVLVAKLQHRNLVRLLGFSLQGKEKLLIYEFLPNTSLDHFIFDPIKCTLLNWEKRYKIICGIARGLLYLHEDSQLRIIHRDLKASNVLLDEEMNPKISDFGMAKLFVIDQTQNTNRIVGTYGYMAPEYALHGFFSVKSDVYSFGVLLLEIVSGRKSLSQEHNEDLLCYAWRHWKENTALEFIDATLRGNCSIREVMRCIHIGLLCVQEEVADRPTMASVNLMFSSSSLTLQIPASPGHFGYDRNDLENSSSLNYSSSSTSKPKPMSINGASITELHPR